MREVSRSVDHFIFSTLIIYATRTLQIDKKNTITIHPFIPLAFEKLLIS
jgi:hypothetical protein